jgi:hypothetical protein
MPMPTGNERREESSWNRIIVVLKMEVALILQIAEFEPALQ